MLRTRFARLAAVAALVAGLFAFGMADDARADVGMKGDLGLGGDLILGGTTYGSGAFSFGITPNISYHPIDNLAIFGRLPFWEGAFVSGNAVSAFPFLFGARYYFPLPVDKLRAFGGGALGFTILTGTGFTDAYFSMDFQGGVEYEVIDNLGVAGSLDIYLPNIGSNIAARFGVVGSVIYYLPI